MLVSGPPTQGDPSYVIEVLPGPAFSLRTIAQATISNHEGMDDFKPIGGPVSVTVGTKPAVQRDYAFVEGGVQLHGRLVVTMVNKRPVIFYLTTDEKHFAGHTRKFRRFLASVQGN